MKKYVAGVIPVVLVAISGCTTMLAHVVYSDTDTASNAKKIAFLERCVEIGLIERQVAGQFAYAFTQLLSVASYNESLYSNTYASSVRQLQGDFSSELASQCTSAKASIPSMTNQIQQKYASIASQRQAELIGMGTSMSTVGVGAAPSIYMPQPAAVNPSFGVKQQSNSNFLVNTGSGTKLCTVTSSGYARCQ